jgi:hypothetical protein
VVDALVDPVVLVVAPLGRVVAPLARVVAPLARVVAPLEVPAGRGVGVFDDEERGYDMSDALRVRVSLSACMDNFSILALSTRPGRPWLHWRAEPIIDFCRRASASLRHGCACVEGAYQKNWNRR